MRIRLVILALAGLVSACAAPDAADFADTPAVSRSSRSPAANPTAPATPSATSRVPADLAADHVAEVVTNDLVVRSLPEISDRSVIDPVHLGDGQLLFVVDGPRRADGYDWYEVVPFQLCRSCSDTPTATPAAIGWVAASSKEGEQWIAASDEPCINPEDSAHWRPGLLALACLGNRPLVVEGTLVGCAGIALGAIRPTWLAESGCKLHPVGYDPTDSGAIAPNPLVFHIPPNGPEMPAADSRLRLTGHLDNAAAQECVASPVYGSPTQPPEVEYPELAVLNCRASFVVTHVERL